MDPFRFSPLQEDALGDLEPSETNAADPRDRQAPRFPYAWPVAIEVKKGTRTGMTRNVSSGGMFVELDPPLELGRIYTMTVDIRGNRPVRLDGKVVWSISGPRHNAPFCAGMGIMFTRVPEDLITCLEQMDTPAV